ncbi:MAG TPA: queuosine precursor transporter [Bacillota bacterium]
MSKNNVPRFSPLFLVLASFFVTFLLISNIIAGKLALFWGITLPAAVILFPLTYILGDTLTEVYGFQKTRLVIWIGLGANLIMVFAFMITLALPYPDFWNGQPAFTTVLGLTPRLVGASLAAYLMGSFPMRRSYPG